MSPIREHEFSRVGLLAELPGQTLRKLSDRMERESVPAGTEVMREGEDGERFYVVLSGMLAVTQEAQGERRMLKPGDYFGEVALTMDMPRTASVRRNDSFGGRELRPRDVRRVHQAAVQRLNSPSAFLRTAGSNPARRLELDDGQHSAPAEQIDLDRVGAFPGRARHLHPDADARATTDGVASEGLFERTLVVVSGSALLRLSGFFRSGEDERRRPDRVSAFDERGRIGL